MAAMLHSVQPPPSDFRLSVRPCSRQGRGSRPHVTARETGHPSCVHGAGTRGSLNLGRNPDQAPGFPNQLSTASCLWPSHHLQGFPGGSDSKESACNEGDPGSVPGLGRSPGEGNGYLPGESHGQGSLAATVHGITELDMTEQLSHHL